jgi:RNA polymerase sporulation-specific sigma factor
MIKISRDTKKRGINIMRIKEEFKQKHNREPQTSELSAITGLTSEDIIYALDAISPVYSLQDSNIVNKNGKDSDGGENTLENFISCEVDEIESATNKIALKEALDTLPDMQRELIMLRYFKNLSQQQTAKFLGITQVKVSREEKKIFQKLKELLG